MQTDIIAKANKTSALGNNKAGSNQYPALADVKKRLPFRILTPEQFAFWQRNGYLVIKGLIPKEQALETADFLWEFQQLDKQDPRSWYAAQRRSIEMAELNNSGMVEVYNNQTLWNNRQHQNMYDLFVDIWDIEQLWVSIDRANLNPPNKNGREFNGFIHWDVDSTITPRPVGVQGVLALSRSDAEVGGFQCVPELFHGFDQWVKTQPADRDHFQPDMTGLKATQIEMEAGDMLIFNALLAHGILPNSTDDRVRLAQYITMQPAEPENHDLIEQRVACWDKREIPTGYAFPGDPREWEKTRYPRAELSALGEKLLGLKAW